MTTEKDSIAAAAPASVPDSIAPESSEAIESVGAVEGTAPRKRIEPRALLQRLQKEFSAFRDCKPLALKIDASIAERMPDLDRKSLRAAMRLEGVMQQTPDSKSIGAAAHIPAGWAPLLKHYGFDLKAVERAQQRFDLEGQPVGEVTEEKRTHASTTLKERFAAVAKQQKDKREAEAAEKRRTEKLQQLMTKFGR